MLRERRNGERGERNNKKANHLNTTTMSMDENFRQLIDELKQEIIEKITDTTDRVRVMCLGTLKSAEENLNIPQSKITIRRAIDTVRKLLENYLRFKK